MSLVHSWTAQPSRDSGRPIDGPPLRPPPDSVGHLSIVRHPSCHPFIAGRPIDRQQLRPPLGGVVRQRERGACRSWKTPLIQSALQHPVLRFESSASGVSRTRLLCGPHPNEGFQLADVRPTAQFEWCGFCPWHAVQVRAVLQGDSADLEARNDSGRTAFLEA